MNKLKDHILYPVTLVHNESTGSGLKVFIHTDNEAILTRGSSFDKALTMAGAELTDMAYALAMEERIPAARGISMLNNRLERTLAAIRIEDRSKSLTDIAAIKSGFAAGLLTLPAKAATFSSQMKKETESAIDAFLDSSEMCEIVSETLQKADPDNIPTIRKLMLKLRRSCKHSQDLMRIPDLLSEISVIKGKSQLLSDSDFKYSEAALISLPVDTALKFIICNIMHSRSMTLSTLSAVTAVKQDVLEEHMGFYHTTKVSDLLRIIGSLHAECDLGI